MSVKITQLPQSSGFKSGDLLLMVNQQGSSPTTTSIAGSGNFYFNNLSGSNISSSTSVFAGGTNLINQDGVNIDYVPSVGNNPGYGRISVGNGTGADSLAFYANGPLGTPTTPTLYLSSVGTVGVGTSTPSATLTVVGTASFSDSLTAANNVFANNVNCNTLNYGALPVLFGITTVNAFNYKLPQQTYMQLYTVPAGKTLMINDCYFYLDSKIGETVATDTLPTLKLVKNFNGVGTIPTSAVISPGFNASTNAVALSAGMFFKPSFTPVNPSYFYCSSGDAVWMYVSTAATSTNTTLLSGRVVFSGMLF